MSVRLYGRSIGNGSLSVVTAGFRQVLEGAGLLEGFVALDKQGGDEESTQPDGALARDGVFTGNLQFVPLMQRNARHERHWVQVTPNSTHVPHKLLGAILELPNPRILSASQWGTGIIYQTLADMGVVRRLVVGPIANYVGCIQGDTKRPLQIHTVHHGISGFAPALDAIATARHDFKHGHFRVIHFSTTDGERKGTFELVQAWQLIEKMLPGKAELLLVLDYHAHQALRSRMADLQLEMPASARVLTRGDFDAATMSQVLCRMHLVCAPSRGEGFGLVPLQALACGVPVAATLTTGHSAGHLPGEHVTRIRQLEKLEPIDDGPGAMAPPLYPADIAEAIAFAHDNWTDLSLNAEAMAPDVIKMWSWEQQLAPLVGQLR